MTALFWFLAFSLYCLCIAGAAAWMAHRNIEPTLISVLLVIIPGLNLYLTLRYLNVSEDDVTKLTKLWNNMREVLKKVFEPEKKKEDE